MRTSPRPLIGKQRSVSLRSVGLVMVDRYRRNSLPTLPTKSPLVKVSVPLDWCSGQRNIPTFYDYSISYATSASSCENGDGLIRISYLPGCSSVSVKRLNVRSSITSSSSESINSR